MNRVSSCIHICQYCNDCTIVTHLPLACTLSDVTVHCYDHCEDHCYDLASDASMIWINILMIVVLICVSVIGISALIRARAPEVIDRD